MHGNQSVPRHSTKHNRFKSTIGKLGDLPEIADDVDLGVKNLMGYDDDSSDEHPGPESRLAMEVLIRGLCDFVYLKNNPTKQKLHRSMWLEVRDWIRSDEVEPYSFLWIIQHTCRHPTDLASTIRRRVSKLNAEEAQEFHDILMGNVRKNGKPYSAATISTKYQRGKRDPLNTAHPISFPK